MFSPFLGKPRTIVTRCLAEINPDGEEALSAG